MDYLKDVKIDHSSLDLEWLDQPELAVSYGKAWAEAKRKVALIEEEIKVKRSELIREAWENPNECLGQPKAQIQTVEAYYRTNKKYKKLKQELIVLQEELDLIEVAKNEVSFTRKSALENMVKLYVANYFAGPNVPRNLDEVRLTREQEREHSAKNQVKVKRSDYDKKEEKSDKKDKKKKKKF